jgi:hypothetical protein
MREWNLSPDCPVSLTLATDARINPTDYTDDQIWELNIGNSEPPAISLHTTFGLRARSCRIFPRFTINGQTVFNPKDFFHPLIIHDYFPNYIKLSFKPFSSINVVLEYWVPDSHAIGCRTNIINTSSTQIQIQLEWAELLIPADDGHRMSTTGIGLTTILAGQTNDLAPVLLMTGGVVSGKSPYPALSLTYAIQPHAEQEVQWVHASLSDINNSSELAKSLIITNWDVEFAKIYRVNSQRIEITTGDQQWDTALYISQTLADQLVLSATESCRSASFVISRNPDQGFSLRKDGSDYNHLWSGQTPLGTYYLSNFLLPGNPELLKGFIENFLASQSPQGEIDMKPGLGGQRNQLLATPILAQLAWDYYRYTGNVKYIETIYSKLLAFFLSWFSDSHDRDNDSVPEWDQSIQSGFEDHPIFSYSNEWSMGLEISSVESPDLCSFLYQEAMALMNIAKEIQITEAVPELRAIADGLTMMIDQSWNDTYACFQYRDRDSHVSASSEILGQRNGSGLIDIHREFEVPIRPLIRVNTSKEGTRPIQIYIHGTASSGGHRVEHISSADIHWRINKGYTTSNYTYKTIEQIEIAGLSAGEEIIVRTTGMFGIDQTLLLPLWAGIPSDDKARILINLSIMNKKRFLSPYGLRPWIGLDQALERADDALNIHLPWINFITRGLLKYNERKKAAVLFSRLMKAAIQSIKTDLTLHQFYQSETGKPLGAKNSITGLIPLGLFLEILGVKIINPSKIELTGGGNPFPWPVTVKYRGLTIVQQKEKALIIFSDGQNITVDNNHPKTITMGSPQ